MTSSLDMLTWRAKITDKKMSLPVVVAVVTVLMNKIYNRHTPNALYYLMPMLDL